MIQDDDLETIDSNPQKMMIPEILTEPTICHARYNAETEFILVLNCLFSFLYSS